MVILEMQQVYGWFDVSCNQKGKTIDNLIWLGRDSNPNISHRKQVSKLIALNLRCLLVGLSRTVCSIETESRNS